ncbi:hypothetical protein AA14337_0010 [Acetobacter malorum DSM 14337]|uniref:Uncharacterized protein n=1 Tax=Acetobacter malorum DSM 14337 TaxID=1307910 RepID=A0ABQ0PNN7_9PROT|nr:hypothetical protein [Acetobacter malorum]KXV08701.1 hypothetical protein AD930_03560 [Acetobacter malorum]GBQ74780.1 hypothetical protein AA14337_0010 [Acetobacter malorum DSM 14337]
MADLLTDINNGISVLQSAAVVGCIAGAVVGVACAGSAAFKLWDEVQNGNHPTGSTHMGLIAAVIVGSIITIFSIIIGWFSLFFTGT